MDRRLPVYLLVDCSESMVGPAIESVRQGIDQLVNELKGNPLALETAYLSVITFSRYAKQEAPLTELIKFQIPKLTVRPGTALGAALALTVQCLAREVIKTTAAVKGDYRPLVFLLTDGQPTDDWEKAAEAIRGYHGPRIANIYAIGCGPDVDAAVLKRITDVVFLMPELAPETIRKFFVWLTASIRSASVKAGKGEDGVDLPPLPPGVLEAVTDFAPRQPDLRPRQVFLHALCGKTRKPYLMRYALQPPGFYEPIAGHPLESFDESDGSFLPPINSSLLNGAAACPYCGNPGAGMCGCGALFCTSPTQGPVTCPKCNAQLVQGDSGAFDITRSEG